MEKVKDAIYRQDAIDALCDNCDNVQAVCPHYPCKQYTTIGALPPAQPEQRWIPVTERLPEDSAYVLLTVRRMDDSYNHVPFISTGYISWNHQCWWCAHDGNCKDANIEVIAWMPLPEPYGEDGEAT